MEFEKQTELEVRNVKNTRRVNYRSYDDMVTQLAVLSLRFSDDYTKEMFDVAVNKAKYPNNAIHPIPSITGKKRICKVITEFREKTSKKIQEDQKKFELARDEIKNKSGHIIISCQFGGLYPGKCRFTCGYCGADNQSCIPNLRKSLGRLSGRCQKCMLWADYDELCADFEQNKNFTLAMTHEQLLAEYRANSYKCIRVTVRCKCEHGELFTARLGHLRHGDTQGCNGCKLDRQAATNVERHGVPNPMQHPDILDKAIKNAYRRKEYTLPSGRIEYFQGFEYDALMNLISGGYICGFNPSIVFTEENILMTKREVGRVFYTSFQGKRRYYFPDLRITDTNIYMEVKSTYTLLADLDVNLAKFKAVCELGSQVVVIVVDDKDRDDIHFAELDITNIDAYMSKMRTMREVCAKQMRVAQFRDWYDIL